MIRACSGNEASSSAADGISKSANSKPGATVQPQNAKLAPGASRAACQQSNGTTAVGSPLSRSVVRRWSR